ncbi:MAG TPA: beta-galactosidase family protein, partial [Bacteroidota bacterium]|nr:beta-galactosidase family protein [Bacteroidota bacterium]
MRTFFGRLSGALLFLQIGLIAQPTTHTFALGEKDFLLDGKPFQIIAGEMHYPRIPRQYWRQRLQMAKAMGLNAITTYVFWNFHEPLPDRFDFSTENHDVASFVRMAKEEGLWVILRPGPYVCAEWEFGGYPWWLLKEKDLLVRSQDARFLKACDRYLQHLGKELSPLQITKGGPIILVQVENEYGSYGSDKLYMGKVRDMIRSAGFDVPLFTADGPYQCRAGYLPGVLPAINGEENPASLRDTVNKYNAGKGPYFIPEFYPGWLDSWGERHNVVPVGSFLGKLDTLLLEGASVSLYMFHGGSTFGFMNGANYNKDHPIVPQPTTYDYDAPLDEAGRPTAKYEAIREMLSKHLDQAKTLPPVPASQKVIEIPAFKLSDSSGLYSLLGAAHVSNIPLSMEDLNQGYGYILYRTTLTHPSNGVLKIGGLRDYALVFVNKERVGILDRRLGQDSIQLNVNAPNATLEILVENLGRINYGKKMTDNRKGIVGPVLFEGVELRGWSIFTLPFDRVTDQRFSGKIFAGVPVLRRGFFSLDETGDTWFDMRPWGKGTVWINGHHIGRYWYIGAQQTLYVPAPYLRKGKNEVVVFEQLKTDQDTIRGIAAPIIDELR